MRTFALFWVLCLAFIARTAIAAGGDDYEDALRLRAAIEVKPGRIVADPVEKFILPVTQGFSQQGSQLCWAYATLNALETLQLAQDPKLEILLSRGYLQHSTWQDRFERHLDDPDSELSDRGTALNAILLIGEKGLSQYRDYSDISTTYDPDMNKILGDVAAATDYSKKVESITRDLDTTYHSLPNGTDLNGTHLTALDFGHEIVGQKPWMSYAIATSEHPSGMGPDPDPDARGDYQVDYVSLVEIQSLIHDSLANGVPVIFSNIAHLILIYGAEYDSTGAATTFYIKDSYPGYFYEADPANTYESLGEITTIGR